MTLVNKKSKSEKSTKFELHKRRVFNEAFKSEIQPFYTYIKLACGLLLMILVWGTTLSAVPHSVKKLLAILLVQGDHPSGGGSQTYFFSNSLTIGDQLKIVSAITHFPKIEITLVIFFAFTSFLSKGLFNFVANPHNPS